MRLLQRQPNGALHITRNLLDNAVPPYAILSHTWGDEEVIFEDVDRASGRFTGQGRGKAGYGKIEFCSEQAAKDGFSYFWIDSCCIDRTNSQELQEAIISMFRWYQSAAKCYVYLEDVSTRSDRVEGKSNPRLWEQYFRASRWFTRGWTLQELLATKLVEFYSYEGVYLGNKESLKEHIQETTGIAMKALEGTSLDEFTPAERMAWAKTRQTTRPEDMAYSLLGIFNISMTVQYGEGLDRALERLLRKVGKLKGRSSHENAQQLQMQVLETRENALGQDQPRTLASMDESAMIQEVRHQEKAAKPDDGLTTEFWIGIAAFTIPILYAAFFTTATITLLLMGVVFCIVFYMGTRDDKQKGKQQVEQEGKQEDKQQGTQESMPNDNQEDALVLKATTNMSNQPTVRALVDVDERAQRLSEPVQPEKQRDLVSSVIGLGMLILPIVYAAVTTTPLITFIVMFLVACLIYALQ